ncbi:MAG: class I SAM-dependent methyltransferase [Patescibacteria group bacterium]
MAEYFEAENRYLACIAGSNKRALDVGCGPGRVMEFIAPLVQEVVGIDYNSRMVALAAERLKDVPNVQLVEEDIFNFQPPRLFDLVFASYNLPGSCDIAPSRRQKLLIKLLSLARSGGDCVVSFWKPTSPDWLEEYYQSLGAEILTAQGNIVTTTMGEFTRFSDEDIADLVCDLNVEHTVVHLTPMFDLVHFRP